MLVKRCCRDTMENWRPANTYSRARVGVLRDGAAGGGVSFFFFVFAGVCISEIFGLVCVINLDI